MNKTNKLFLITGFSALIFFTLNISSVKAITVEEIQAQIQALLTQIAQLQQELIVIQSGEVWCHDFNVNLRYGDDATNLDVAALQKALNKEGLYKIIPQEDGYFGDFTASAVTGFQEKYASDILTPWGLKHGTGYVGSTTRAKLNELYGCGKTQPSITVLSPNGGEQWKTGETRTITWSTAGYNSTDSVRIGLRDTRYDPVFAPGEATIVNTTNTGSYIWAIPSDPSDLGGFETFGAGNVYKVVIYIASGGPGKFDLSNSNFSITSADSCYSVPSYSGQPGKDIYTRTTTYYRGNSGTDYCINNTRLKEYFCSPAMGGVHFLDSLEYDCPNGCKDGACKEETACTAGWVCSSKWYKQYLYSDCRRGPAIYCSSGCSDGACVPSITVTSPNGGEKLVVGNTYDITWDSISTGVDKINIELVSGSTGWHLVYNVSASSGKYSWTIPSTQLPGFVYKIHIWNADGSSGGEDYSDNYFSIASEISGSCNSDFDCNGGYCVLEGGIGVCKSQIRSLEQIDDSLLIISRNISDLIKSIKAFDLEKR